MKIKLPKKIMGIAVGIGLIFLGSINGNKVEAAYTSYDINGINASAYPGVKEQLQKVQAQYPNWKIKLLYTGIDWNYALESERVGHGGSPKSLIHKTYDDSWFCTESTCINRTYDVSGNWKCASKQAIAYMMDPRNSLTADYIFQFQDLGSSTGTRSEIERMVAGSFISSSSCVDAIMQAAQTYNISPFHLVSRILQEQGTAGMGTMNGYVYTRPDGTRVIVYNLFNISVSGNNANAGLLAGAEFADREGWYTKEASILGGAKFLREKYIDRGQSTLYFQKYNVVDRSDLFGHQYMQNIRAANDEGNKIYQAYQRAGVLNSHFEFTIPLYEGMPSYACPRPAKVAVTDVIFPKDTYVIYEDEAIDLPYTIVPYNAGETLDWDSSNPEVLRVFGNRFRGLKEGTADVIVRTTSGSFEKRVKVYIRNRNKNYVQNINISKDLYIINIDEAIDIGYSYTPTNSANAEFYWDTQNNGEVIRVFGNRVRGLKEGTAEVVVNTLDKTVEKRFKVVVRDPKKAYVQNISVANEYALDIDEAIDIPYTYTPTNAVNAEFYWDTSNAEVIRVFGNRVRGLKEGTANIIIRTLDETYEKKIRVTVKDYKNIKVQDIKIPQTSYTVNIGEAVDIPFTYEPADVRDVGEEWISSNPDIIRVFGNRFRALQEGIAEVIVRTPDGRIEKRIKVTVNDPNKTYVTNVQLSQNSYTLNVDEAIDIPYTYTPTNAVNAEFYWDTSNPEVLRVFGNRIRGLKEGTAEIIITTIDKSFEKRVKVTVKKQNSSNNVYVTDVKLDKTEYTVYEDEAIDIPYSYAPTNATNAEFYWDTSNPEVLRVFGNRIRGLKEGTAEIIITTIDKSFEKRVKVTVKKQNSSNNVYVTDVKLDKTEYTVYEDEAIDIPYSYAPTNATNAEFYWDTSNPEIIRVFGNRLRGLKAGTTELIIRTLDGKFEKRVKVTVKAK